MLASRLTPISLIMVVALGGTLPPATAQPVTPLAPSPVVVQDAQVTWYVDDDAPNDPGPGDPTIGDPLEDGSLDHPFDAIQEAINASVDGDTVLVADGLYVGVGNKSLDYHGKSIVVSSESGPGACIIDCQNNGGAFVFQNGETPDAQVIGFTLTGGQAERGGAVYCRLQSSPTIANCILTMNGAQDGGGVHCREVSNPLIRDSIFLHNTAHVSGGGVYCRGSSPTIMRCAFEYNSAAGGGAMRCINNSRPVILDCVMASNAATASGGAVNCFGGTPVLLNCLISRNYTLDTYADGGGIYLAQDGNATILFCTITGNTAHFCGGAIMANFDCSPIIYDCTIAGNRAQTGAGGGIYLSSDSNATIADCIVVDNRAWESGGGVICYDSEPLLVNCSIAHNSAPVGGGLHSWSSIPVVSNSIVFGNTLGQLEVTGLLNPVVSFSDIEGN